MIRMEGIENKNSTVIDEIYLKDFRSFSEDTIKFNALTVILGKNGSGKTNIFRGLECLYGINSYDPKVDIHGKNQFPEIKGSFISIKMNGLRPTFNVDINRQFGLYLKNPEIVFYQTDENEAIVSILADTYWLPRFMDFNRNFNLWDKGNLENYIKFNEMILLEEVSTNDEFITDELIQSMKENQRVQNFVNQRQFEIKTPKIIEINKFMSLIKADTGLDEFGQSSGYISLKNEINLSLNVWTHTYFPGNTEGIAFEFRISPILPNIYFIKTSKNYLLSTQTEISDDFPTNPSGINNDQLLFSIFHYRTDAKLSKLIDQIVNWAEKFGYNKLTQVPEIGAKISLKFTDSATNASVDLAFSGSGFSSLIYLIAQCIFAKPGEVLIIDEPELHLHSTSQATLLDLFVETTKRGVQVILATHSDFLIQRLQRRISENIIENSQVSIIEVIKTDDGSITKEIHLMDDGSYKDELPESTRFALEEFNSSLNAKRN